MKVKRVIEIEESNIQEIIDYRNGEHQGQLRYEIVSNAFKSIAHGTPEPDYVGAERLKARQRGYEEGYHNGMKIGKTLNPQIKRGEWRLYGMIYYCSECGHDCEQGGNNFCGNCGADMRGEGNK